MNTYRCRFFKTIFPVMTTLFLSALWMDKGITNDDSGWRVWGAIDARSSNKCTKLHIAYIGVNEEKKYFYALLQSRTKSNNYLLNGQEKELSDNVQKIKEAFTVLQPGTDAREQTAHLCLADKEQKILLLISSSEKVKPLEEINASIYPLLIRPLQKESRWRSPFNGPLPAEPSLKKHSPCKNLKQMEICPYLLP